MDFKIFFLNVNYPLITELYPSELNNSPFFDVACLKRQKTIYRPTTTGVELIYCSILWYYLHAFFVSNTRLK